jgi:outer membrane receptor protein involved in Fe transport
MLAKLWFSGVLLAMAASGSLAAQGTQTGALSGFVRDGDGLPLPGAVVMATSSRLQGTRSATTDGSGAFVLRGLPPGVYDVTFEFASMRPETRQATVTLGSTTDLDVTIRTITATESVIVTASRPSLLASPLGGLTLTARTTDELPIGRTPSLVAEMSPALTNNTPNSNQVTINGGFAFDNVFMIDGVDINDNLLGNPDNLFIEEAVEETQILTSALSAEYGRASGGVINLVTKRGGDLFSGSIRTNLSNPAWTDETPFEKSNNQSRLDKMDRYHEGVLGGPIQRTKVWFFAAGRTQSTTSDVTLPQTAAPFEQTEEINRWELKLTATPWANQTLQGQYTQRQQSGVRPSIPQTIDPNAADNVDQPGSLLVANWNGVVAKRFFATAQYSQKENHPRFGNTSTALVDSPFLTIGRVSPGGLHFNAPYFDRTDPEDRDNYQLTGSLAWLTSTPTWGTHDVKTGVEHFVSIGVGGNSQSSTGFIFNTDYLVVGGRPAFDTVGRIIPVWIPGTTSQAQTIATRGAELRIKTTSAYVQDRWVAFPRLTLDLGVRLEHASSEATGDIDSVNAMTWMPRLAATFDVDGSGRTVAGGSFSVYSGKYVQNYINRNTAVGNPARVTRTYIGPAGEGRDFAPAYDPANYSISTGTFPTANVFFDDDLSSAHTNEVTFWAGRDFSRGNARATYVWRRSGNFIETFTDNPTASGKTEVVVDGRSYGTFDNVYYRNSDEPVRNYQALIFQGEYRLLPRVRLAGHWTAQLHNDGNFEGETANNPGTGSVYGDYPEVFVGERNNLEGRLDDYQAHKLRLWAIVNVGFGRFGSLDLAPLWRYNSALTYSVTANVPLSAVQRTNNPGYARLPASQTIFFGERGSEEFAGYGLMDVAATYQVPVWQRLRPWVKVEVLNIFNNDKLIAWNTTVVADPNSALDPHGLPTGYLPQSASFGQGTAATHYPRPRPGLTGGRTYLAALGLRF